MDQVPQIVLYAKWDLTKAPRACLVATRVLRATIVLLVVMALFLVVKATTVAQVLESVGHVMRGPLLITKARLLVLYAMLGTNR